MTSSEGSQRRGVEISMTDVSVTYRRGSKNPIQGLVDVSLDVPAGQTVAIMGPSGSGKSTLLHILGAMHRPDCGTIDVGGVELTRLSDRELADYRRRVGFVFQRFHLLPSLGVLDNVLAPLLPFRVGFDKRARAIELLRAVGLDRRQLDTPSRLSGGEQQRVAIARALINYPRLLLADEPTGNLDSETGAELLDLISDLQAERGVTVIVATHDPQVTASATRLIRLRDGRVVGDAPIPAADPNETLLRVTRLSPT